MDILSIDSLSDAEIGRILDRSAVHYKALRERRTGNALAGKVIFNLFYENSTRTLMSFATAGHRLGAAVVTLPVEQSSVKKGESLEDTLATLGAMRPDLLVLRHRDNGAAELAATIVDAGVINAGDGTNEHPTQALLDAATLIDRLGSLQGKTVAICGDIRHSRVARSNTKLLRRLGAQVRLAGPPPLMPEDYPSISVNEAIADADVVMMLRVQRERLEGELGDAPGEFLQHFGLTEERLARARPGALVMHPGPMNRGVEIADSVADDAERSVIRAQVGFGVATRMACIEFAAGAA